MTCHQVDYEIVGDDMQMVMVGSGFRAFSRLADRILAHAPTAGGSSRGEGSVWEGIGRLLDGD